MCFGPQRPALFRHVNFKKCSENGVLCTFWLGTLLRATTACAFSTSQLQKVVRTWCALYILTCKCASRHNGVHFSTSQLQKVVRTCGGFNILTWKCASGHNDPHFFDISTSKSAPRMVCFVHFDLELCFAPQRRALFRHLNFKKWSEHGVFCTFWLGNVLRATTACTFSTSQLQKVVRTWCVLYILTWKCASRHNGVHFSTSQLQKVVRTWCALYILTWKCASRHNGVHFSTSQLQKVVRTWCALHILTCKCASRHNGVHFSTSQLPKVLRTSREVFLAFPLANVLRATMACNFLSLIWPAGSAPAPL